MILGTGQLTNSFKNINKTVGKFNITKQTTITGKGHGCHSKNLNFNFDLATEVAGNSKLALALISLNL